MNVKASTSRTEAPLRGRLSARAAVRATLAALASLALLWSPSPAAAAGPCDGATHPNQCGWFDAGTLPPFVHDAIAAKGGVVGPGNVLVLSSGDAGDQDEEISNPMGQAGCGTNPDGYQTYDCNLLGQFVPPEDSVVLALSSEWYEWYQTSFTDWMTISSAGVPTVDVSINSWINNKVDIIPYGPWETGVVILTSLSAAKMIDFRVADSGDSIYDTALVVVPATWMTNVSSNSSDETLLCGDGVLEPGEDCDDGNYLTDDDCNSLCLGSQTPPSTPPASTTCGNLSYEWPNGTTSPYTCGQDLCQGFRCVVGNTISPACYTADQCAAACAGSCVDVQTAQLDCSTMCTVQPSATEPPPVIAPSCASLNYEWADGTTMPYSCDDDCVGQRCVTESTISTECYVAGDCDSTTCPDGTCIDTPAADCGALCAMGEKSETCTLAEKDSLRVAANQVGACLGNVEQCSGGGFWEIADGYYSPVPELCNGLDDDCNGVADDMYVTCGDPGLCQNTINTCDPANPSVPILCTTLTPPSPVEICNDGLDNDCEGSPDDGCSCGDNECMPGENYIDCPGDCPAPANGTPCEDGDLCTAGDTVQAGVCTSGAPVVCDDGNACVINPTCDPATGCSATKLDCSDADPCTIDSCDAVVGCLHTPDPACGPVDADVDGHDSIASGGDDCDDSDPDIHPGAAELCNAIDEDCDGIATNGFDVGTACVSAANACGQTSPGTKACSADGLATECDAVTPANPAGYGDACNSPLNDCGQISTGFIQCDGFCSATTPANPVGYGDACNSAPNACGETASGSVQCDGSCDAATPTAADGDADGTADCIDGCPADAAKTELGICGCGVADVDVNGNGITDCDETVFADLAASVEQRSATPRAGRRLKFRVEVSNLGPDTVDPATITASFSGSAVADLKLPKGCTGTVDAFTCDLGSVRGGRSRARTISVIPSAASTITLTATVSSAVLDLDEANQTASVTTMVP